MELSQQNAVLEKELDIANRRLDARRDHVKNLEAMLKETEVRLVQQNQKFEEQLETMRKMLEEAKCMSSSFFIKSFPKLHSLVIFSCKRIFKLDQASQRRIGVS